MEKIPFDSEHERITKIRIPSSDAVGWIKALYESGLTGEEVEKIMVNACDEYAGAKLGDVVERLARQMEEKVRQLGRTLNNEEKQDMREWVLQKLRQMPPEIIEKLRK